MCDAHNLGWKLAQACINNKATSLLDDSKAERKPPAWEMITLAYRIGQVMMAKSTF